MSLTAMVLNPDMERRRRFREISATVASFKRINLVSTLSEGLDRLKGENEEYDVLYISSRYQEQVTREFVNSSKGIVSSQDSAYMLLASDQIQDKAELGMYLANGIDAVLNEPFSVEELLQSTEIASKVKKKNKKDRESTVVQILVAEAIECINKMAQSKSASCPYTLSSRRLFEIKERIEQFSEIGQESYFSTLIEEFGKALPIVYTPSYQGVSNRVRQRIIRRAQ